jgi:DNA-binding winged helix-turn-helix (wHTH) protein/TolB-like protein
MPSIGLANREFRVGDWLVQPQLARIRRGTETIHVAPRAMDVLVHLAEANGEVVSRNHLLDAVWPRMAVTPDALTQCLVELRRAFGDDPKHPTTIETIPKIGVRLIQPVVVAAAQGAAVDAEPRADSGRQPPGDASTAPVSAPPARSGEPREWMPHAAAALAIAFIVGVGAFWVAERLGDRPASTVETDGRSIAVLPPDYESTANDRLRLFADAMHDELLTRLAKIGALDKVVSRAAVERYRGTGKTAREVGAELGVGAVLESRVREVDAYVRLDVHLVDAQTNAILWANTYTEQFTAESFFAIQREITAAIADALDATLASEEAVHLRNVPTHSTRAHDFYLSGNDYLRRINEPHRMLPLVVQQYTRATEEDPSFALAWAALGRAHALSYWYGIDRTSARRDMADAAIRRAFELVPSLPEARLARAEYLWQTVGDHEGALNELAVAERALPNESSLYLLRAAVEMHMGDWDRAIADFDRALELDPRNVVYLRSQSHALMFQRDYPNVERKLERILEIAPDDGTAQVDLVHLELYAHGDTALARRYETSAAPLGYADALAGTYVRWLAAIFDRDYARAMRILDESSEDPVVDGDLRNSDTPKSLLYARTHLLAGHRTEGVRELQLARGALERRLGALQSDDGPAAATHLALAEVHAALGDAEAATAALARIGDVAGAMLRSGLQLASTLRVWLPLGETDRALEELDDYLSKPGRWSIEGLLADPRIDTIRNDPRFGTLVQKYKKN